MVDEGTVLGELRVDGVEIRHLRAFVAVAEELNFGRAAARLYVSQPALSRQIRGLERFVGCELLRRSTHRVELTLAGSALLARAKDLLVDLSDALDATRAAAGAVSGQVSQQWKPFADAGVSDSSLPFMRDEFEAVLAQHPAPPEVPIRPIRALGVPALVAGGEPGILHLHGGGNVFGSAFGYQGLAGALALACGQGVVVPEYRLMPEHPFPAPLDDVYSAYLWLLDKVGPGGQVVVSGDSSGAGLVLALLLRLRELGDRMPARTVLLCPVIDPAGGAMAADGQPVEVRAVWDVVKTALGEQTLDERQLHPLSEGFGGLPPMLVQVGSRDPALEQAEAIVDHAARYGVQTTLERYPTDVHVFHTYWSILPDARDALANVGNFICGARSSPSSESA